MARAAVGAFVALTTFGLWSGRAPHTAFAAGSNLRSNPGFTANTLPANDDESTPSAIDLGFDADFFGRTFQSVFVNNNGNVTFDGALRTFTPFALSCGPDSDPNGPCASDLSAKLPIIAPFFADVDTRGAGSGLVQYGTDTVHGHPAFGVNWVNVGYFNSHTDKLNSFQLVLISRSDVAPGAFDVEFNYDTINWETGDASGGANGLGGNSARAGYTSGTGATGEFLELAGSGTNGAFLDNGPNSLAAIGRTTLAVRAGHPVPLPPAPSMTTAISFGQVGLAWNEAPVDPPVTVFRIYRGSDAAHLSLLAEVPATQTTFNDTGLAPGDSFFYAVTAVNNGGEGPSSPPAAVTLPVETVPDAPVVTATPASPGTLDVAWTVPAANGSDISAYNIYRGTGPNDLQLLQHQAATTTTLEDSGLTFGSHLFYAVSAVNTVGEGPRSPVVNSVVGAIDIVAHDDAAAATGGLILVRVLDNDTNGTTPAVVAIGDVPGAGSATVNHDNTITYTPNQAGAGEDHFTYTVQPVGAAPGTHVSTATVTVTENLEAVADAATTGGLPVTVDVLANDVNVGRGQGVVTIVQAPSPSAGAAVVNDDNTITFTPEDNVFGRAVLVYQVAVGDITSSAEVHVDVEAADVDVALDGPQSVTVDLRARDPHLARFSSSDPMTVVVIGPARHGDVTVGDGTITYTPADGFPGQDIVRYRVTVPHGGGGNGNPHGSASAAAGGSGSVGLVRFTGAPITSASDSTPPAVEAPPTAPPSATPPGGTTTPPSPLSPDAALSAARAKQGATGATGATSAPSSGTPAGATTPPSDAATADAGTAAAPTDGSRGEVTAPAQPPNAGGLVAVSTAGADSGPPGVGLEVNGEDVDPHECSSVFVFLDADRLGETSVRRDGTFSIGNLSVPGDAKTGPHALTTSCSSTGIPVLQRRTFTVAEAATHRSEIATALHPLGSVSTSAKQIALSLATAAALVVLIAFPAELFNTTLEEHYDEVRRWFGLSARTRRRIPKSRSRIAVVAFFAISAALYGLLDPTFRLNLSSAGVFGGLVLSLVVVTVAFTLPSLLYMRRRYGERGTFEVLPGTIALAAGCVALSRAFHFQPGYIYGMIAGFAFDRELSRREEGGLTAISTGFILAVSVIAWLVWNPMAHLAQQPHPSLAIVMLETALAATFVAGLESTVVSLLPLRFLEGEKLIRWNRKAWVALFGFAMFGFVHVLLRSGTGYVNHGTGVSTVTVMGLFLGFGLFSVIFWAYFRVRGHRHPSAHAQEMHGGHGSGRVV